MEEHHHMGHSNHDISHMNNGMEPHNMHSGHHMNMNNTHFMDHNDVSITTINILCF